jgi:hypothetical protein
MVESFNYVVEHELVDASVMPDLYGPEARNLELEPQ